MFEVISVETLATLDQINAIVAVNPSDARVVTAISQLRSAAQTVLASSAAIPDTYARGAAKVVHDGLLCAASICERLRQV